MNVTLFHSSWLLYQMNCLSNRQKLFVTLECRLPHDKTLLVEMNHITFLVLPVHIYKQKDERNRFFNSCR